MMRLFPLLALVLSSCGLLPRSTPAPVRTVSAGPEAAKELTVLLPGRWSTVDEFEREGFFESAKERWPEGRVVAADLHLGYYKKREAARRIHEDIIVPARENGVTTVRVVGISMGGLGALIYDLEYPDDIDEMYLLSPFVGDEEVIDEIRAAGGLRNWEVEPKGERDFSRMLWCGLKSRWIQKNDRPEVRLACGTEDRLVESNRLFVREFLDSEDALWREGDHDWPTWRRLFREMIK